ncbi:MAG: HU family DNA-binding protein [Bacilli bacterium]|nr:HU family DNA-binding protein [Bacilli bacterium]
MADKKIITKEDLAEALAKGGRLQKGEALKDVELVFAEIAKGLNDPEYGTVKIAGFGSFVLTVRPGRVGVNPSNPSQKIQIPASKAVKFKPSKTLKDIVNGK